MSDGAARRSPEMLAKIARKKAELAKAVVTGETSLTEARIAMQTFVTLIMAHVREHE